MTQLAGGALAAMTAAYLGSRFSVAGTVIGAAIASIIAGVGGALYTASLRHTRDKVKSVWTGRVNSTPAEVVVTTGTASRASELPAVADAPPRMLSDVGEPVWRTGRFWKRVLIGVVAVFAITVGTITGLELVSGQALSGGQGTTVERVRQPQPAAPSEDNSEAPSDEPSDESSESPSPEPTEGPSEEPSDQDPDGATEQPTDQPTEQPTEQPREQQSRSGSDESSQESRQGSSQDSSAPQSEAPRASTQADPPDPGATG